MDAEAAVHRRAVDAEEDAVGDGRPGWVLGVAIEAHLVVRFGAELAEDGVLICEGLRRRHGAHPEQQSTSPIEP